MIKKLENLSLLLLITVISVFPQNENVEVKNDDVKKNDFLRKAKSYFAENMYDEALENYEAYAKICE